MDSRTLCIYVDESGNFGDVRDSSRYCMVTLVFQDESAKNAALERGYGDAIFRLGADPESMVFHSAPLIRQEDQFSAMSRNMRGKLFYQMLSFVRKSDLRFHLTRDLRSIFPSRSSSARHVHSSATSSAKSRRRKSDLPGTARGSGTNNTLSSDTVGPLHSCEDQTAACL